MESSSPLDLSRDDGETEPLGIFAFLNHSANTLYHNLPPSVDDKPLARQKRKRTSPEDQILLETAYSQDPKPDKAARLELVKQVALGEKEVQIWFQNRRQSSRRKSRPLLPHELAKYQLARSEAFDDGYNPGSNIGSEFDPLSSLSAESVQPSAVSSEIALSTLQSSAEERLKLIGPSASSALSEDWQRSGQYNHLPTYFQAAGHSRSSDILQIQPSSRSDQTTLPNTHLSVEQHPLTFSGTESRLHLKRTSSLVRLSMTADGNAQVTTKDASSPSPPRPSPSLTWSETTPRPSAPAGLHRTASGRSRDSRSWEFWCNKEARSELESKAEKDASGSATNAIGLIRSASGRSILGALPSKRNTLFTKQPSSAKRLKLTGSAPTLKSSTSHSRLQGTPHRSNILSQPTLKHSRSATSIRIPGNESDKENWSPDREKRSGRKAFGKMTDYETTTMPLEGKTLQRHARPLASVDRRRDKVAGQLQSHQENDLDPEDDAELASFMHADRDSASPSEEDDLDCVQGLLSLSQGNWR